MSYWIIGGGILFLCGAFFAFCVVSANGARMEEEMRERGEMPSQKEKR